MKHSLIVSVLTILQLIVFNGCAAYMENVARDVANEPLTYGMAVCKCTADFYKMNNRLPLSKDELKGFWEKRDNNDLDIDWNSCHDFTFTQLENGRIRVHFMYSTTDDSDKDIEFSFTRSFDPSKEL